MFTGGADLGGFLAFIEITAVHAAPSHGFVPLENLAALNIRGEIVVAFFMLLLPQP